MPVLLNRDKLLEIFGYLNERLRENQLKAEITLYDGSVMTLIYDGRPATQDIDCVFSEANPRLFDNILKQTQYVFGLQDGWINDEIKTPLSVMYQEDKETYRFYSNLTILKPVREQLLAMKILAARPEPAKDFYDAYVLAKDLGVTTKDSLLGIIKGYIPVTLLGDRQIRFIKYLGEDLGYDWG